MTQKEEVGNRIAQARREMGVRLRRDVLRGELAEAVGVDPSTITAWEQGKKSPREEALAKLADYLGVTPAYLRYGVVGTGDVQPLVVPRPKPHDGVRREDGDAVRERQQAKRNAAKKAVAGGQPHPARPAKPR